METPSKIINEIDLIWGYHLEVRAHFPFARPGDIGKRIIESSPYYFFRGHAIKYDYGKELDAEDIKQINEVSNWLNQNALIRLYALMNYHGFVSEKIKIDQSIRGCKELDLLRRLRNHFAHTDGRYNINDEDQISLVDEIEEYFGLIQDKFDHIPISIDQVIEPIFEGCKEYVQNKRTI
jgi:hypothetical protein